MTAKVAICVPSAGVTSTTWAAKAMALMVQEAANGVEVTHVTAVSSAVPDHNKNNSVYKRASEQKDRWGKTDTNRNALVGPTVNEEVVPNSFFDSDAEWVFWMDDDTIPPPLTISRLLDLGREFVAGVYFNPKYPYNPIAYIQREDNLYHAFYGYPRGSLVEVDSVGMGCTLIHRSVYERIMDAYELWVLNETGTVFPVLKEHIENQEESELAVKPYVRDGMLHRPVRRPLPDNNQPWPFYTLEYGRTEDHYFCEKAAAIGIKPYLDTTIECDHLKLQGVGASAYSRAVFERKKVEYEERAQAQAEAEAA